MQPQELSFWACFGYHPTGLRRRTRKQPVIHWLVCGDETHAVELLPVDMPSPKGLAHVCLSLGQRRWEIATAELGRFDFKFEFAAKHFGCFRLFAEAPSGYNVEALLTEHNQIKAGPPLEES